MDSSVNLQTDLCPCGKTQTMSHTVESCPDKTEWRFIPTTLCRWRRCFLADQLWFMTSIREEEESVNCSRQIQTFLGDIHVILYQPTQQCTHSYLNPTKRETSSKQAEVQQDCIKLLINTTGNKTSHSLKDFPHHYMPHILLILCKWIKLSLKVTQFLVQDQQGR